jgi:preprotein translocase subunit SecD
MLKEKIKGAKMPKLKLNWKIWVLIIAIIASVIAIFPLNFEKGVQVVSVTQNSTAYIQGIRAGDIITAIDKTPVSSIQEYNQIINSKLPSKQNIKLIVTTKTNEFIFFTNNSLDISMKDIEKTRLKTGLDLSGGARALVSSEEPITSSQLNDLISVTNERLNIYGLKDIQIRPVTDLSGKNFMLIEIAGSTPKELENLIAQQGKFEAKIGNETLFVGGNKDITYVARTGDQAGIYSCQQYQGGYVCSFRFSISLSEAAAKRHADITNKLSINSSNPQYLDKNLDLYLDGKSVESLFISKDLKGSTTTQIAISGSGTGVTQSEAYNNANNNMKQLQTVLITGSLPFKLKIEKLDSISPLLGKQFINTIFLAALAAIVAVGLIIFLRYKKIKLSLAVLLTCLSEILIILGVSALFKRNLDLPSIAGIIAAIGTGVDAQIIILDESQLNEIITLKEKIKRALFIIFGSYATNVASLLPLLWAGAGLLKGFAITTILGVSIGVFITRPAFSEIVKLILKDQQ